MSNRRTLVKLILISLFLALVADIIGAIGHSYDVKAFIKTDLPQVKWTGKDHVSYPVIGGDDMVLSASCSQKPRLQLDGLEPFPSRYVGDTWFILDQPVDVGTLKSAQHCVVTIDSRQLVKVTANDSRSFLQLLTTHWVVAICLVICFFLVFAFYFLFMELE